MWLLIWKPLKYIYSRTYKVYSILLNTAVFTIFCFDYIHHTARDLIERCNGLLTRVKNRPQRTSRGIWFAWTQSETDRKRASRWPVGNREKFTVTEDSVRTVQYSVCYYNNISHTDLQRRIQKTFFFLEGRASFHLFLMIQFDNYIIISFSIIKLYCVQWMYSYSNSYKYNNTINNIILCTLSQIFRYFSIAS